MRLDLHNEKQLPLLRPLTREDFNRLVDWINAPHVARWWDGAVDLADVINKYEPRLCNDSPTKVFVIQTGRQPVGIIQCYRHADYTDWDRLIGISEAAGIDYLIGERNATGKGLGTKAIGAMAEIAFELYPEVRVIVSVPNAENRASWRALEKAGFTRIRTQELESDCPSDAGLSCIYTLHRSDKG